MNHPALATSDEPIPPPPTAPSDQHEEQALDEALKESFPASDPIAVDVRPTLFSITAAYQRA